MNTIKLLFCLLVPILLFASCTNEDDLDEIFVGKTWYMNGGTIDGQRLNSDVKNFYTSAENSAYYISFQASTFHGALAADVPFSGTWHADGKSQSITLTFNKKPSPTLVFDKQLYYILTSIRSYGSGANFLRLAQDGQNLILFTDSRNKIYN